MLLCYLFFFFFKQKTAYEMRISDWSSDVCSSDLTTRGRSTMTTTRRLRMRAAHETVLERGMEAIRKELQLPDAFPPAVEEAARRAAADPRLPDEDRTDLALVSIDRSAEHTSELQSLMRNSYDVLCLKKKKERNTN